MCYLYRLTHLTPIIRRLEYQSSNPSETFSDEDVEIDEDDSFAVGDIEKRKKPKFEFDYKVHDVNDIINQQNNEIDHVCNIFGIQVELSTIFI